MTMDWYHKLRKYIGPLELVLILAFIGGIAWYVNGTREERRQQQALQALKDLALDAERRSMEEEVNNPIRILDSTYVPFMMDSLCRYTDATRTRGYLTMTKYAPSYEKLCSTAKDYYMWVGLDKYFPGGQLVRVTGIAQDDRLIQFHFTVAENGLTLDDMLGKLDSTLHVMQRLKQNAHGR